LIEITQNDVAPLSVLTRELFEKAESYDEAVKILSTTRLIAPAYFIVGGIKPNEGVVITRDQAIVCKNQSLVSSDTYFNIFLL
jgi:hypothetical protein